MPNFQDVNQLRSSGQSDPKIINSMRHSGMNYTQTYDAMKKADLAKNGSADVASYDNKAEQDSEMSSQEKQKTPDSGSIAQDSSVSLNSAAGEPPSMPPPPGPGAAQGQAQGAQSQAPGAQAQQEQDGNQQQASGQPQAPPQAPPAGDQGQSQQQVPPPPGGNGPQGASNQQSTGSSVEEIEEVVETIIDERWKEVTDNIKKVIDWKNLMDQKFEKMDQEIKDLKENFNELYKAIVGKIGDYDRNLLKVGSEMKAMEKVFSKVLPTFTENVNDLARVAEDIRAYSVRNKISKDKKNKD